LFPKGHWYNIDELVHLLIAEGLVDSCNQNKRMIDVGRDYINEMVSGSFLQPVYNRFKYHGFIMHDLIHDLAESLSKEDFFRLEDHKVTEIPCAVRYLSVSVESMKQHNHNICKLHHLRTVICIYPLTDDVCDIFHEVFHNLKKLRVLHLYFYNSNKLPESVGELKYLRYLNLARTSITELPGSLCALYHLQLLHLNHRVKSLPDKLWNLSKLRHLEGYIESPAGLHGQALPQIPHIGKLTLLQHLKEFCVQKQKEYDLGQLRDMKELGGTLRIRNLENVTGKDQALESRLDQKSRLESLDLEWSCSDGISTEDNSHLEVLEGLMPPRQLRHLAIQGYKSVKYPGWSLEDSYFENLESVTLHNCIALESLPCDSKLIENCSSLSLSDMPNLKTLPCLPSGLQSIYIHHCPMLVFITNDDMEQYDQRDIMRTDHLASQLALLWDLNPETVMAHVVSSKYSSLNQLMVLTDRC
jgi:Leucine-rich repeat (LRR) protein